MWKEPVEVRRSLWERTIDDMEYESRRHEAKAEKLFDDVTDGFIDGVVDFVSDIFGVSKRR